MGTKKARLLKSKKNKNTLSGKLPSTDLTEGTLKGKKKHHRSTKSEIEDIDKGGKVPGMEEDIPQATVVDYTTALINESIKPARKKKKKSLTSHKIKSEKSEDVSKEGKLSSVGREVKTGEAMGEFTETLSVNAAGKVSRKKKSLASNVKFMSETIEDDYPKRECRKFHPGGEETAKQANAELVDEISDVDTDCSKGMKKWLNQYWSRRPGLKVLQDSIDQFLVAHEAAEEKARKEREALAAEGGWTVVVHHKGRKKTTDAETGVTVGSVAQAAIMENLTKKKKKETPLDFYRFQKREAKRNEVMQLQSRFEQEKKRIQQLRAARKFRPY